MATLVTERRVAQRRQRPVRPPILFEDDVTGAGCYAVSFTYHRPDRKLAHGRYLIVAADAEDAAERARNIAAKSTPERIKAVRLHANAAHLAGGALHGFRFASEIYQASARGRIDAELDGLTPARGAIGRGGLG